MCTHDSSQFFCKSSFTDTIKWRLFVVFSLVMASCGFVAVTVTYCCQNRSEMLTNANIQKLQIFSVVITSFDSFISECSI